MGLQRARKLGVRGRIIRLADRQQLPAREIDQARRQERRASPRWRPELGNHVPAVGHEHGLSGANLTDVFGQAVLELPQTDALHADNVAA